jgi:hypothetical protein
MRIIMTKSEVIFNVELAQAAYLKKSKIDWNGLGLELVKWLNDKKTDTQGFVAIKGNDIHLVWRGSASPTDFLTDASVAKVRYLDGVRVHFGFLNSFKSVEDDVLSGIISSIVKLGGVDNVGNIYISGHSLGGALTVVSAFSISTVMPEWGSKIKTVTVGCPRVGNHLFKRLYNQRVPHSLRIVHDNDLVTRIPKLNYFHIGQELKLASDGKVMSTNLNPIKLFMRTFISNITADSIKDHMCDAYLRAINSWNGRFVK